MAKRKYDLEVIMLTLFVAIVPIMGAISDKTAVIYASLLFSLVSLALSVKKTGKIFVTKTAGVMLITGLMSLVWVFFVTDKASQTKFGAIFFAAAAIAMTANWAKNRYGEEAFSVYLFKVMYVSALVYAFVALFYQIFVEANPLFGGVDLGGGSSSATAMIMMLGTVSCIRLFYGKAKTIAFYPSIALMGLVFVMTGSLVSYLAAAILALVTAVNTKRKKIEVFIMAGAVALLSLVTVIGALVDVFTGKFEPEGAFRGVVSIVGIGCGGYDAIGAVTGGGYASYPVFYNLLIEALGIFGVAIIVCVVLGACRVCTKAPTLLKTALFLSVIVIMCTSSAGVCYMAPLLALVISPLCEEEKEVIVNKAWSYAFIIPVAFCALMVFARIPYRMGLDAYDLGKYGFSADCYRVSAFCQMFDAETHERAYEAKFANYGETGEGLDECIAHLESAMKFNKKNYLYRVLLADVYTKKGDVAKSLEIWDGIIARYDKEELYVEYAGKIRDAIRDGDFDIVRVQGLYNKLLGLASQIENEQIKFEVNNILSESQRYYIEKREGKGEVYYENLDVPEVEFATEAEEVTEAV